MIRWYYALISAVEIVVPRSGGMPGYVFNGADAARLWEERRNQIESLALQRMQPRAFTGGNR